VSASGPHELSVLPDAEAVARRGAEVIAGVARVAVADRGSFAIAVSGGRTPAAMFDALAELELPWVRGGIWQVDERIAPEGDADRNLPGLLAALPEEGRRAVHPMPVTEADLEEAAARYATGLPASFDVVHLGLGDDGHTASLAPGDPALEVADRDVAVTGDYRGRRRMTMTYRVLDRSPFVLWLVTGGAKADALGRLLAGDVSIPAGRVRAARQLVLADRDAMPEGSRWVRPPRPEG
jgi:6-phosphogluconolactonase